MKSFLVEIFLSQEEICFDINEFLRKYLYVLLVVRVMELGWVEYWNQVGWNIGVSVKS